MTNIKTNCSRCGGAKSYSSNDSEVYCSCACSTNPVLNNKYWANISVVENGYVIDTYQEKYTATDLKHLIDVISHLIILKN